MKAHSAILIISFAILVSSLQLHAQGGPWGAPKTPVPYPPLREADVLWSKKVWQVMDFGHKVNLPFSHAAASEKGNESFINIILDALHDTILTAFDVIDDNFLVPVSYEELSRKLTTSVVQTFTNPLPPYNSYDSAVRTLFDPSSVKQLRIKEEWFFDKQRSVLDVRIIGLCPVAEAYDEDGEVKGYKPLFWIYFPEARNVLVQHYVFNRFNDTVQLTYDDIFIKRFFYSYVYKESTEDDKSFKDFTSGMDALMEADRVKKDIYLLEKDLWEY